MDGVGRVGYRNPASPAVLSSPGILEVSRASSATPTASSSAVTTHSPLLPPGRVRSPANGDDPSRTPRTPLSSSRTRSMSDLLSERDHDWGSNGPTPGSALAASSSRSRKSSNTAVSITAEGINSSFDEANDPTRSIGSRES